MNCLIAEDHPLYREAIINILTNHFQEPSIVESDSLESLHKCIEREVEPDIIFLDLCMPGVYGYSGLLFLKGQFPSVPIVVMSAKEGLDVIQKSAEYGAIAYIPKSTPSNEIVDIIKQVLSGETFFPDNTQSLGNQSGSEKEIEIAHRIKELSPRQFRILMMLTEGKLNKQISAELHISLSTVKSHMSTIMKTLGVSSRTHAALVAKRLDIQDDIDLSFK